MRLFGASRSAVVGDDLGRLSRLTTIPQNDRAEGSDRRRDREERGQRTRIQLADTSGR
jgi:hypothetical protein